MNSTVASRLELLDAHRAEDRARALLGDDAYEEAYSAAADGSHVAGLEPDTALVVR